jgi:hypothetical protein
MEVPKVTSAVSQLFEDLTPTASGVTAKEIFG